MATQHTLPVSPPVPVELSRRVTLRLALLEHWHLLSLDAPTVAVVWTWFLAHSLRVELRWQEPAAMFLAVWALYALDRLLDARGGLRPDARCRPELEERHYFHRRHGRLFAVGIVLAGCALGLLLNAFSVQALRLYLALGALLAAWFGLIHVLVRDSSSRLPKEFAVGVFFPLAAGVPTAVLLAAGRHLETLALALLLLGTLCSLNCLFIFRWEHPSQSSRRAAHPSTRFALAQLSRASWLLVAVSFGALAPGSGPAIFAAIGLSALLLLALDRVRDRLAPTTLRAAADLVLLTPLLFAGLGR